MCPYLSQWPFQLHFSSWHVSPLDVLGNLFSAIYLVMSSPHFPTLWKGRGLLLISAETLRSEHNRCSINIRKPIQKYHYKKVIFCKYHKNLLTRAKVRSFKGRQDTKEEEGKGSCFCLQELTMPFHFSNNLLNRAVWNCPTFWWLFSYKK